MKKVIFITLGVIVGVMAFISICTYDKERIIRDHEEQEKADSIFWENLKLVDFAYADSIWNNI